MLEWARQGGQFCITAGKDAANFALFPNKLSLQDMYGHCMESQDLEKVHKDSLKVLYNHRKGVALSKEMNYCMEKIELKVKEYGSDFSVDAMSVDGECERELEQEIEMDLEREKQYIRAKPRNEKDWKYGLIFSAKDNLTAILGSSEASSISTVIKDCFDPINRLDNVPWRDNIYCTKNFVSTVSSSDACQYIQDFLRSVDTFIYFEDLNNVLLVSEREANSILSLMWDLRSKGAILSGVRFVHLAYAREAYKSNNIRSDCHSLSFYQGSIDAILIALLQLFNGETTFKGKLEDALKEILAAKRAKIAAILLPHMRGLEHTLRMSELEITCTC